jgi:hypothetical protein
MGRRMIFLTTDKYVNTICSLVQSQWRKPEEEMGVVSALR